jgi:hypothetical protein
MKKNMFKVAFVAAIAMVCGVSFMNSQKSETLSEVALANVEALADFQMNSELCIVFPNKICVELHTTPSGSSHKTWYDQINKTF